MEATSNVHPSYSVCDDGVEEIPWSVTELKSGTGDKEEDVDDGLEQSQTRRSFLALSIKYGKGPIFTVFEKMEWMS